MNKKKILDTEQLNIFWVAYCQLFVRGAENMIPLLKLKWSDLGGFSRFWALVNSIPIWWKGFSTPIARTVITFWQPTLCLFQVSCSFLKTCCNHNNNASILKGIADHEGKALNHHLSLIQCLQYNVKCIPLLPPFFMFGTLVFHGKAHNCRRSALQAATLNTSFWNERHLKRQHLREEEAFGIDASQSDVVIYVWKTWYIVNLVFLRISSFLPLNITHNLFKETKIKSI